MLNKNKKYFYFLSKVPDRHSFLYLSSMRKTGLFVFYINSFYNARLLIKNVI